MRVILFAKPVGSVEGRTYGLRSLAKSKIILRYALFDKKRFKLGFDCRRTLQMFCNGRGGPILARLMIFRVQVSKSHEIHYPLVKRP